MCGYAVVVVIDCCRVPKKRVNLGSSIRIHTDEGSLGSIDLIGGLPISNRVRSQHHVQVDLIAGRQGYISYRRVIDLGEGWESNWAPKSNI